MGRANKILFKKYEMGYIYICILPISYFLNKILFALLFLIAIIIIPLFFLYETNLWLAKSQNKLIVLKHKY